MPAAAETPILRAMWSEPYLETCCRSALHRLILCGAAGRPEGLKDQPCLERMAGMGLVARDAAGRYRATAAGVARHDSEILGPTITARATTASGGGAGR
ncbi:hypothetical protein [Nguyenibacter sp. L1]|uniref:hypothetical protein n=1 Tax=Nguyenibacter sp. L1 TaxID=3049350 RepID=UPI0038D21F76